MIDLAHLQSGDAVPSFSRLGSFQHWNRYAAVNHEFADHHMDDAQGRHEGFASAFGMAPLTFSYVQTMLREWVGDHGRITEVRIQLRNPFLRGRTLTATGRVTVVDRPDDDGAVLVHADVWADDDLGTRIVQGSATVAVVRPA